MSSMSRRRRAKPRCSPSSAARSPPIAGLPSTRWRSFPLTFRRCPAPGRSARRCREETFLTPISRSFSTELRRRRPWLPQDVAHGYARRYGTRVESLLNGAKSISDLGRSFGGTLYEREARFLAEEEWATEAEDILERRTKHGLASDGQGTRRFCRLVSRADAAGSLMTSPHIDDSEFRALRELSAALGADPLRTQGAGGNTSIKRDGVMWIKASGTWLADALAQDIMTPVRLDPLRKAIADGDPRAAAAVDFVDAQLNASGLRPSIETSVHAIIPSPVVVHIHCVNTIALAVRHDGEALVARTLEAACGSSRSRSCPIASQACRLPMRLRNG